MADVITSSIDLKRMAEEATAAGFNPLSVLRSGLAAGWARQTTQYGETIVGGVLTPPDTGGPAAPPMPVGPYNPGGGKLVGGGYYEPDAGHAWDPNVVSQMTQQEQRNIFGGSSEPASSDPWSEESERNIAIHQARLRTGAVITDDGVYIPTRPDRGGGGGARAVSSGAGGNGVPSAGGPLAPLAYSASTVHVVPGLPRPRPGRPGSYSVPSGLGYQPHQLYEDDKLPNTVTSSTFHMLLPGIYWEESPGIRGDTAENIAGDFWGNLLMVPKNLHDFGLNARRAWDANMPTWSKTERWLNSLEPVPGIPRIGADGKVYVTGGGF